MCIFFVFSLILRFFKATIKKIIMNFEKTTSYRIRPIQGESDTCQKGANPNVACSPRCGYCQSLWSKIKSKTIFRISKASQLGTSIRFFDPLMFQPILASFSHVFSQFLAKLGLDLRNQFLGSFLPVKVSGTLECIFGVCGTQGYNHMCPYRATRMAKLGQKQPKKSQKGHLMPFHPDLATCIQV